MQIDPNVKGYINMGVAVCGVIGTLGVNAFPSYIPPGVATNIISTASLIFMIYGGLNSAGNFLSSNKPGALAPPNPPVVKAAIAVADLPTDATSARIAATKYTAKSAVDNHQP